MGKRNPKNVVGRGIIKDRFGKKNKPFPKDQFLHTSQLDDGYEWGRLNLQSVTEQSNLEDFLTTAELAGTEFTAEKLNVKLVDHRDTGLLTKDQEKHVQSLQQQHESLLCVPRRPKWDESTSPEELDRLEKDAFLEWRRSLASLQEVDGIVMTPYEKNLDFWRQLWRVVERSDIIVQIVDARNPLLFHCIDLEHYVEEFENKVNLLLINKADFLTSKQRVFWADYFSKMGVQVAFWSAVLETERQCQEHKETLFEEDNSAIDAISDSESNDSIGEDVSNDFNPEQEDNKTETLQFASTDERSVSPIQEAVSNCASSGNAVSTHFEVLSNDKSASNDGCENNANNTSSYNFSQGVSVCAQNDMVASSVDKQTENTITDNCCSGVVKDNLKNNERDDTIECNICSDILSGQELLELFRRLHTGEKSQPGIVTVGMVGYPNVGKSSTINAILKMKKVPVSATPGRTKHFQTLYVDRDLMLCDCPGLVFPSFVSTKADLIVNGILPIDQMRDHIAPVSLISQQISRQVLEHSYGISISKPVEGEDPQRPPTAYEVLSAHGYMRGFMTANGMPDCSRSARYVLKDYVNGRLLYCHPPPGVELQIFETENKPPLYRHDTSITDTNPSKPSKSLSKLDRDFFKKIESGIHSLGVHGVAGYTRTVGSQHVGSTSAQKNSPNASSVSLRGKPWKKHGNHKRKEKLRRLYKEDSD